MKDHKRAGVLAFQGLNYRVVAAGDSYNDTNMLAAADTGLLIHPPANVVREFPQFRVANDLTELRGLIDAAADGFGEVFRDMPPTVRPAAAG